MVEFGKGYLSRKVVRFKLAEHNETEIKGSTYASLSYVLGVISGIVVLAMKRGDEFVRFHAIQSIGLSVMWIAGTLFLTVIPVLGLILSPFWGLLMFVLWLVLIVKSYQGEKYTIPIVGSYIQEVGKRVGL